ncbi:MAG TPA: asparagine synthase (glutamine-hydrolyzing) [Candidatus Acidoferrum sp.]|nr:asparagine synthase (glutamine-hydrolyzing) [Candidatus Acidoferrum sp.]
MCGIAGYWGAKSSQEHPVEILNRMGAALAHRGPDDSGIFHDVEAGIGLTFRRLSILDLSAEGHQPMYSASGRFVMVFNGEVYNFEEIRAELGAHPWRGSSDTEVILEAFERWGVEGAVKRFVGMFAIALWDREERKLHLVRDRLGIKPLYYGRADGAFVFGSELKAIWQHPEFDGEIDRDALALYMRHNYVPSPHCIYKGLKKLPPGCLLTVDCESADAQPRRYWSAKEVARAGKQSPVRLSDADTIEELHRLLLQAVRLRMISDVPIGAFLSGGVDSSTVVALMQAQSQRPIKTFTIGFQEAGYNEAVHARRVADHLHTDHTELYLSPGDALNVIPMLPGMYDEPFSDSSQIPTYLVSKLARQAVTVALSGDGGDEIFGGYSRYTLIGSIWKYGKAIPRPIKTAAARMLQRIPPQRIDQGFSLARPFLPKALWLTTPGDKVQKLVPFLTRKNSQDLYYQALSHWDNPAEVVIGGREPSTVRECIAEFSNGAMDEEAMMLNDLVNYLPDDILTKLDRASMATSLEARVPLLDHRVVEFAWTLPPSQRRREGLSKWILRQILHKYIPPELVARPKMGFGVPIGRWLRGQLKEWVESLLDEDRLRREGYFNVAPIRRTWKEHMAGRGAWQYHLWDVLMFQAWLEENQRRNTPFDVAPAAKCASGL